MGRGRGPQDSVGVASGAWHLVLRCRSWGMKYLALLAFTPLLVGCIHEPVAGSLAVAPGTSGPSAQQVSSCRTTRTWHNIWTIAGTVFGGAAGAQGTADAVVKDQTTQTAIGIGVASAGVLAAISAAAAGIEADAYSTDNCQAILSQAAATP
jgi:hypothetical protein